MGLVPVGESKRADSAPAVVLDGGDHRERDTKSLARAQGMIALFGVSLGFLGILLPHPDYFNITALAVTQSLTGITGVTMIAFAARVPAWVIVATPLLGTISAMLGVIFSGDPVSAYALFFLWPPFYAFYFLSSRSAFVHLGLVAVFYGLAILLTPTTPGVTQSSNVVHYYVIIVGSLAIAAVLIYFLRSRIDSLLTQLSDAARSDLLTGLLNGRGFDEVLNREIERARLGAHRVSVLTVQLGGAREAQKKLNPEQGDAIYVGFGELLEDSTRRMDPVARTGPAEYSIALPETDESTAFLLAEQILGRARRSFRDQSLAVSASIGVATFPKHAASADHLTQAGVAAAEAARALGSDRAVVFSAELDDVLATDPSTTLKEQRTHLSTVLSLAEVLDLRDARTASHSMAVARYCELLGKELRLPAQRIKRLRLAGLLHDIGKVGIADSIFEKPGPLSPAEWDEVRRHPELAGRILGARELADIREWIVCRHEQPDGHGYPRGLRGDDVPLESRILAVAESYDAMTSERPYRAAMTQEGAIAEMGRYVGSQFDGTVVDALVRALDGAEAELSATDR